MNKLEKASFITLLITIVLTPLIFLPSAYVPLDTIKTVVITLGVLVSAILYFISSFKNKNLSIPKHPLFTVSSLILISIILSTLFSANITKSLFGQGFEIGTASFIMVLFLGSLLTVYLTHKEKNSFLYVYGLVTTSFIVILLFHIFRFFFGADTFVFNVFQSSTASLLGKWTDLGIFSGIMAVMSYTTLRFLNLSKWAKIFCGVLMILSAILLVIVNSVLVWSVLLIVLALIGVYEYYISTDKTPGLKAMIKRIPKVTLILVLIATAFVWKGNVIAEPMGNKLKIVKTEVPLPWQLTLDVASDTIKESPFFGAGPNRFASQYLKYKPIVVNPTVFWNTEFSSGFGLVPTFVVNQGIVGMILWIIFIIIFANTGLKILKKELDGVSRFFISSTFFISLFLWVMNLVYVPSHSILLLTFVFSGLFVASIINQGSVFMVKVGENENSKLKKFIPLILILIIVISLLWLLVYVKRVVALGYFHGGISALNLPNNEGLGKAEANFKKALSLNKSDTYYQALSEIDILKINILAQKIQAESKGEAGADPEMIKTLGSLIEEAIGYTKDAISVDPTNYYNYIAEARISELASSFQIQNAYENTKKAYTEALKYNPYSPAIYLNLARIEVGRNNLDEAKRYIGLALQLKQNYIDAIFLLSQIQVTQGQIGDAIISVQVATQINPNNPLLFFQLGLLHYNNKDYQNAVNALSQAIKIDNQYANAKYFLGLSYARLGKLTDAIIQFEDLAVTNPENEEIALILANLKDGKSPFTDAKAPIDNKPEKRKSLPIRAQ